jgi:hypothetical protein
MSEHWPVAELDPVRRLRVLAAANPGAMFGETVIAAEFDRVWAVAADLEAELPRLIHDVRSARVTTRDGERLELRAVGRLGQRARFDVDLRPGWCWMQSRFLLGGLAAVPDPGGTRFAFAGGLRLPGMRLVRPVLDRTGPPLVAGVLRRLTDDVLAH